MVDDDKKRFAEILTGLGEMYGRSVTTPSMRIWFAALESYTIEQFSAASSRYVTIPENTRMPVPADIVSLLEGSTLDAAMQAWTKFKAALERVGTYQTVVFDDPVIHAVCEDMGGWIEWGNCPESELKFMSIDFRKRYQAYRQKCGDIHHSAKLIGIAEAQNRRLGYEHDIPSPVLIGDRNVAEQVMLNGSSGPRLQISVAEAAVKMLAEKMPLENDEMKTGAA